MKKVLKVAALTLLFSLLGFLFFLFIQFHHSKPRLKGNVSLDGLSSKVEIIKDYWGIPHIFAQNEKDLFFTCGYVHAQERMWQMELTRRAGFGRLSELFGKVTLERDELMRNFGLKEAAQREFEKLSPRMKELIVCYCKGINSWINSRKLNWPPEFLILRHRPEPWKPLDSFIVKEVMALLLCTDYPSEAVRAKLAKRFGAQKALEILEIDIERIPPEIEEVSQVNLMETSVFQGSNNWVIDGSRTESGKPLLANDPHLEISLPPMWYEIHLNCPSINVIGVSLPGVPLVIIGHNDSIAWGITNSAADVQDLYIEKLNSSGDMYFDRDGWKPLLKKEELIEVKGQKEPKKLEIDWTARGPIISPRIIESDTPFSLKWTIYEGGETFEGFYLLNKAKTWRDFSEALRLFDVPSQNFVYADRDGNIGYYLSGKIPIRLKDSALFPFPAWLDEGSWKGFLGEEKKPHIFNPEEGFIITANHKIIPDDFPHYISVDWDLPFRAERIKELLLQQEKHTIESLQRIQNDIFSKEGELLLPIIKEIETNQEDFNRVLGMIKDWDLQMTSGSGPALYKVFINFFFEEAFKDELGEDFESFDSLFRRKQAGLRRVLSDPVSSWFDNEDTAAVETREDIIKISLERAFKWLEKNHGSPGEWDWMEMHSLRFKHVLGEMPLFKFFNRGPFPLNGDAFSIRASFSSGYETTHGASYRQIIDLSDWNKSVCVITSGQSGHFLSRFYDDQIPLWLKGEYHPMLFYREDIKSKSSGVLVLKPSIKKKSQK